MTKLLTPLATRDFDTQMSLDDMMKESLAKRDDAINRAEDHANDEWKKAAQEVIKTLCQSRECFTADDVWEILDTKPFSTHTRKALGGVVRGAVRDKWCVHSGEFAVSRRRQGAPVPIWKSLLYNYHSTGV